MPLKIQNKEIKMSVYAEQLSYTQGYLFIVKTMNYPLPFSQSKNYISFLIFLLGLENTFFKVLQVINLVFFHLYFQITKITDLAHYLII